MAAAKDHVLLKVGGAAVAAGAAYEFLYKPWKAAQNAAILAAGMPSYGGGGGGGGGSNLPYVVSPTSVGIVGTNLDPGASVGGPTGTCMHRKGWTQQQCQTRLDALVAAFQSAHATLTQLQSGAETATAQAALAANQTALQGAMQAYNQALAHGDQAGANQWKIAIDAHNADIAALSAAISSIPSKITDIQNEVAGLTHDYQALTGLSLG